METNNSIPFNTDSQSDSAASGAGNATGASRLTGSGSNEFAQTVKEMWRSRPVRIPSGQGGGGKIAGVCEGIGIRYQIDPTLIRIIFVLAAFLGGGIVTYLAAWLIMPKYSLEDAPVDCVMKNRKDGAYNHEATLGYVFIFLLAISMISSTLTEFATEFFLTFGLAFGIWFLLHNRVPVAPEGLLVDKQPGSEHSSAQGTKIDLSHISPVAGYEAPFKTPQAPDWDPLGVAPFAWDLPEPGPAPKPKKSKRMGWLGWTIVAMATFGIIGSIVAGGFSIKWANDNGQFDDQTVVVREEGDLQSSYRGTLNDMTIDLRDLPTLSDTRTVDVKNDLGRTEIWLPNDVPVDLECVRNELADMNCTSGKYNSDKPGGTLKLRVETDLGEVEVH